ncbi:MAG: family efflux transporter, subunit, partial [Clostridiales bacterium]|nr:family efflux transporter, subunit [Clostridiales bacterium]
MKLNYIYKKSSIFIHMGILLLSIALTACSSSAPASTGSRQAPAVNVKPVKAVISPIELTVEYPATLLPYQEVNVTPESTGKVVSLDIDVGMQIEKGQTLFHLESTDLQNQFKQQQLSAEQALNKAQTAYEDAKTTLEKNQILYASGVIAA